MTRTWTDPNIATVAFDYPGFAQNRRTRRERRVDRAGHLAFNSTQPLILTPRHRGLGVRNYNWETSIVAAAVAWGTVGGAALLSALSETCVTQTSWRRRRHTTTALRRRRIRSCRGGGYPVCGLADINPSVRKSEQHDRAV